MHLVHFERRFVYVVFWRPFSCDIRLTRQKNLAYEFL